MIIYNHAVNPYTWLTAKRHELVRFLRVPYKICIVQESQKLGQTKSQIFFVLMECRVQ